MTNFTAITAKQLSAMSGPELLATFNAAAALVGAPICKRFASLTSGYQRTVKLVAQAVEHEAAHGAVAAAPALRALTITPETVAAKVAADPKVMITKAAAPKGAKVWAVTPGEHKCPRCAAVHDITPAGLEGTAAEHRNFCHSCSLEWDPETGKEYKAPKQNHALRSAAAATTWTDAEVAAKRCERHGVKVSGGGLKEPQEYGSVSKAFVALHLPMSKHIKFRGALKAAGTLQFDNYTFVVFDKRA